MFPNWMGVWDFEILSLFNLAMLVSQWWKIISRKNSLVYRVFCHKYFLNIGHEKAKVTSNASYVC